MWLCRARHWQSKKVLWHWHQLKELDENPVALKIFVRNLRSPEGQSESKISFDFFHSADQSLSETRRQIEASVAERRRLGEEVEQKRAALLAELDRFHSARQALSETTTSIKCRCYKTFVFVIVRLAKLKTACFRKAFPGACIIKLIMAVIYGFRKKLERLSLNTRQGWKGLPGTNTSLLRKL